MNRILTSILLLVVGLQCNGQSDYFMVSDTIVEVKYYQGNIPDSIHAIHHTNKFFLKNDVVGVGFENQVVVISDTSKVAQIDTTKSIHTLVQSYDSLPISELKIGNPFPIQTLTTIDGIEINFNELKGKPILVSFWFISCKSCIDQIAKLNNIQTKTGNKVTFIAVTDDSTSNLIKFLNTHSFNFLQVAEAGNIIDSLKFEYFPRNIFIDKKGIVQKIETGIPYIENENGEVSMSDGEDFVKILNNLIAQ